MNGGDKAKKILIISSDTRLKEVLHFSFEGWGYEVVIWDSCENDTTLAIKKNFPDVIIIDIYSARPTDLKLCTLLKDDFLTASIPIITLIDKLSLRSQLLTLKHGVDDYLIKPPDPLDLRIRVEMAMRRAHFSLHASPLTGLPGGRIIEETLKERMEKKTEFSVGYLDIDNFKYFNDAYGYLKGDNVIMQTAYMLYNSIRKFGSGDDFIAHIGGDDFIFITSVEKHEVICPNFTSDFDRIIPFHYTAQDREQGFILTYDRTRKVKKIPLMSISVAVVDIQKASGIKNIVQINERVVEIKRYLKMVPGSAGSKYMTDRRNRSTEGSSGPHINKRNDSTLNFYKPLGQILLEKNFISSDVLEESLRIHWKRGVVFGEILKELDLVKEEQLQEALHTQACIDIIIKRHS